MLDDHLKSPVTRRRLRRGPAADHIDGFASWLHRHGYKPTTIGPRLCSLAACTDWLLDAGFTVDRLPAGLEACREALARDGRARYARGPSEASLVAASLLLRYLRETGVFPMPASDPSPLDRCPLLQEFRSWMSQQRGAREGTLDLYQNVVADLLATLGDAPQIYTAAALREFVLQRGKAHGIWRAKSITTSIRAFLRFLAATGRCPDGLDQAIPAFASWRLASVPRYLEPAEVQRVIAACGVDDAQGLRDRAVILLLARLGLRAGEVAGLSATDIDWKNGRITLCGKGRRREWLPLPQDLGDAMLRYLQEGRPALKVDRVFTRVNAPYGPLTRASVTHIARSALRRAGIKAPINGAHVFRHSAATAMLRQGASLAGVGAVLRHRSPSTTAQYAKVDFGLLAEIAQPWPEVSPC